MGPDWNGTDGKKVGLLINQGERKVQLFFVNMISAGMVDADDCKGRKTEKKKKWEKKSFLGFYGFSLFFIFSIFYVYS